VQNFTLNITVNLILNKVHINSIHCRSPLLLYIVSFHFGNKLCFRKAWDLKYIWSSWYPRLCARI